MSKWWPFKKEPQVDEDALFRVAAAELENLYDTQRSDGMSRQAILKYIEMQSLMLENLPQTAETKATLRANDAFHEQLQQSIQFNLTAGRQHEMAGQLEQAVSHYEMALEDQVSTRFPYEHLRIIYRRNNYFEDALRVCAAAVQNPFLNEKERQHFQTWAERFAHQLEEEE
jgi:hypothetical protein